jgi:signal transduction histidine kinase
MPALRRLPGIYPLGLLLPLLLVPAFAMVLAWQALRATRAQRATVERTLHDYADFAAFILANVARQELERRLLYAFGPIRRYNPAAGQPLPPAAAIGQDRVEAQRCAADGVAPTWLRLVLARDSLSQAGALLPPALAAWVADTLGVEARTHPPANGSFAHIFADARGAGLFAWAVLRDSVGAPLAVYAKSSCLSMEGTSFFALAMAATPALPPSLTGGLPNDSLLSLRVTDPHGHLLYQTPIQYAAPARRAGTATLPGGALLTVNLRPDVADHLLIGAVPYGGVQLVLLLLLLVLLSTTLAVLQLRRQQELLRLRERFISNVSHELRTPLQQILVFAELLRMEKLASAAERQHSIEVVERETRRLIQLVENVLRFSRSARGEDALVLEMVPVETVVRETIQTFAPLARTREANISLDVAQPVVALADAGALRRVLLNLLDNAVKYGPHGQTVNVCVRVAGGRVRIVVDDQGPGIPPADRERVFQPFVRLEREERAAISGSGMGLAIVRDLAERMSGSARVEASPANGARFIVDLPLASTP